MSEHLTTLQIENFATRQLSAGDLITTARHLAICSDCRQHANAQMGAWQRVSSLQKTLMVDDQLSHLSYEQLDAYVNNLADDVARDISANHLASCKQCASVVLELQSLRARLQAPVVMPAGKSFLAGLRDSWFAHFLLRPGFLTAAFATTLLLLGIWWWRPSTPAPVQLVSVAVPSPILAPTVISSVAPLPSETPAVVASLYDSGKTITLDHAGNVTGVRTLSKDAAQALQQALTTQQLETPAGLKTLVGHPVTLMSNAQEPPAIKLVSPIGTFVDGVQPVLSWQGIAGTPRYTVTVLDENFTAVVTSPILTQSFWRVTTPLKRGQEYVWQVTAEVGGKRLTSTSASAPEAHFRILNAEKARELQTVVQANNSHLVRGTMFARAGLLDEAEREFQALRRANPQSSIARNLLLNLRALRR